MSSLRASIPVPAGVFRCSPVAASDPELVRANVFLSTNCFPRDSEVMPHQVPPPSNPLPHFDSSSQMVFLHLWRTYDRLKAIEDELFRQHDLSAQQYNALRLLEAAYPEGTQTMDLGRRLISRMPDTTRMLDRLEKRELIARRRLPENRRVVEVTITPAGRELLSQLAKQVFEMHEHQLGHLTSAQQKQLVTLLKISRRPHEDNHCDWIEHE